jgi:hypothetical protein
VQRQPLDSKTSGCTATNPTATIDVANDQGFEFDAISRPTLTIPAGRVGTTPSLRHTIGATATTVRSTPTTVPKKNAGVRPARTVRPTLRARTKRSAAAVNFNGTGGSGSVAFSDPVSLLAVGMVGGSVFGLALLFVKRSTLMARRGGARRLRT